MGVVAGTNWGADIHILQVQFHRIYAERDSLADSAAGASDLPGCRQSGRESSQLDRHPRLFETCILAVQVYRVTQFWLSRRDVAL